MLGSQIINFSASQLFGKASCALLASGFITTSSVQAQEHYTPSDPKGVASCIAEQTKFEGKVFSDIPASQDFAGYRHIIMGEDGKGFPKVSTYKHFWIEDNGMGYNKIMSVIIGGNFKPQTNALRAKMELTSQGKIKVKLKNGDDGEAPLTDDIWKELVSDSSAAIKCIRRQDKGYFPPRFNASGLKI